MTAFDAKSSRTKRPCPIWVDAFQRDTQHLEADEVGAYFLILMAMWTRPTCDFPDDDHRLSRVSRVSLRLWRSRIGPALRPFFHSVDGVLTSKRLREEATYVERQVQSQSNRKTVEKSAKSLDIHEHTSSTDDHRTIHGNNRGTILPNNPTDIAVAADARAREDVVDEFVREEHVDISVVIGEMIRKRWPTAIWFPGDAGRIKSWLAGGWTRETIEAAVAAKIQGMSQPPRSFKFFEYSIADLVASLNAPLPTGNAVHGQSANPRPSGHSNLTLALARRAAQAGG